MKILPRLKEALSRVVINLLGAVDALENVFERIESPKKGSKS